jgi:hypothetical protein
MVVVRKAATAPTPATRARLSFHLYAVSYLLMGAAVGHGLLFTRHLVGP